MASQVSTGLVVEEKKLLMVFDNETETWSAPTTPREKGELSADTAERAVEELTGAASETVRYRKRMKTTVKQNEENVKVQSFEVEIEGEPENGEWIHVSDLESRKLTPHLEKIKDTIIDKF
ncbi:MAG: NUDIX domain-containing protein [Candidatus Nanohalobium sp.]